MPDQNVPLRLPDSLLSIDLNQLSDAMKQTALEMRARTRDRWLNDPFFRAAGTRLLQEIGRTNDKPVRYDDDVVVVVCAVLDAERDRIKQTVADTLRTLMGAAAAGPYLTHIDRALDVLDGRVGTPIFEHHQPGETR